MNGLFHAAARSILWGISILIMLFSIVLFTFSDHIAHAAPTRMVLYVKSSPDANFSTIQPIQPTLLDSAVYQRESPMPATDLYIKFKNDSKEIVYEVDSLGNLHLENGETMILRPEARRKLLNDAFALRAKHYGQLLSWQEVDGHIPRKAKLTVIDLETGLRFNAQRRAGSKHADVQPLTKIDTGIMKKIYNGKWSWHRRAILVEANGHKLAASMHGMPHGGDGIPDNEFRGHFCIHFMGSTTHGKGKVDYGHQLMVAKASGTLTPFLNRLDPYEIINTFFLAAEYGDRGIMLAVFPEGKHPQAQVRHFGNEEAIVRHRFMDQEEITGSELAVDIPVEICQVRAGRCMNKSISIFKLRRLSIIDTWRIDEILQSCNL